ncbi:hypothetical protein SAMN04515617_111174 [Collimonas sp. OK242]|jgi:opacity protein-like surface antigen|uniref:hypothetical protein n=1 Tax=Collimonas sp. OK242 TaxID=1798195 RepID=UPI0008974723|nr:hypothetical protein [Collimonas sp. OK242]SDY23618.1 hypothetical protein SAMN04515617_111174 [Collimonas sp. OK242]
MNNIRTLMLAVSALLCMNLAQAQTAVSTDDAATAAGVSAGAKATVSTDPLVQKRQSDSDAKADYKAKKKTAKANMKVEKAEAKSELKEEKLESTDVRNKALATDPIPK